MKRKVALSLSALIMLSMVGCSNPNDSTEGSDNNVAVEEQASTTKKVNKAKSLNHKQAKEYIKELSKELGNLGEVKISEDGLILVVTGETHEVLDTSMTEFIMVNMKLDIDEAESPQSYVASSVISVFKDPKTEGFNDNSIKFFKRAFECIQQVKISDEDALTTLRSSSNCTLNDTEIERMGDGIKQNYVFNKYFAEMKLEKYKVKDYSFDEYKELNSKFTAYTDKFKEKVSQEALAKGYTAEFVNRYSILANDSGEYTQAPGFNISLEYGLRAEEDGVLSKEERTFREEKAREFAKGFEDMTGLESYVEDMILKERSTSAAAEDTQWDTSRSIYSATESDYSNVYYSSDAGTVVYPITVDGLEKSVH